MRSSASHNHAPSFLASQHEHQPSPPIEPEYLRPEDAARFLSISTKQLENWRRSGKGGPLFHKRSRRLVLYRVSDLRAWMAECRVSSTAQGHALTEGGAR